MKQSVFTESDQRSIPSFDLTNNQEQVLFAYKRMEDIWDEIEGEPDLPHRHNFFTVIWVKSGSGHHLVDFTRYEISSGRVFFLAPGQVHQVITPQRPTGLVLMFTQEFVCRYNIGEKFLKMLALFDITAERPYVDSAGRDISSLLHISESIIAQFESRRAEIDKFRNESVAAWLKLFLIECSQFIEAKEVENTQLMESGVHIVGEFKELLERRFTTWHQVNRYSAQMGLSADYLNNVLKSVTGSTAKEMIAARLVLEAKRQGVNTSLSSKEIAYLLGFNDPAHFSKFFKSTTGVNFTNFREGAFS
jgi:AraC family transcriptional regulator, transcriptional activator of pobA